MNDRANDGLTMGAALLIGAAIGGGATFIGDEIGKKIMEDRTAQIHSGPVNIKGESVDGRKQCPSGAIINADESCLELE